MLDKIFALIGKFAPVKWRWIFSHGGFRRYFTNTGWMFFGQMFSLLISFFIGAWIARYLGPQNFGVLSFSMSFAGLFSFIASRIVIRVSTGIESASPSQSSQARRPESSRTTISIPVQFRRQPTRPSSTVEATRTC